MQLVLTENVIRMHIIYHISGIFPSYSLYITYNHFWLGIMSQRVTGSSEGDISKPLMQSLKPFNAF